MMFPTIFMFFDRSMKYTGMKNTQVFTQASLFMKLTQ